ncbi:hypothetical protein GQ53DRAFT_831740 [Thozetella sp. PMI_491]|nr:hypothetical protein GQ53DRAFT_831740 [Thozetella sp. PMI_491]
MTSGDKMASADEHEHVPKDAPQHFEIVPIEEEAVQNAQRVDLGWRSWLVVFITSFTVGVQTFVVVAAGQVITFIVRDLGDAPLAGWIIQDPLLMQSVLSPIVGRLSDVLDRKYLSTVPPLIAVTGSVLSAKATSRNNLNFALSVFAFGVEGWVFYSAVNSITPALSLQLGFENNSWRVAIRQLSFTLPNLFFAVPSLWTISYSCIQPSWVTAQYGLNVLMGLGQSGPLALLASCIQFASPHAYLSTATGLGYSGQAIGGAFGSAVLNAIINGRISANYASAVGKAAVQAGLPESSTEALVKATQAGKINDSSVQGATRAVWNAAVSAHHDQYAAAYRIAWASIVPFVFLAIIAVAMLKSVKILMTERVEATVEKGTGKEESVEEGTS